MKTRMGFVSNSSSSSFVVCYRKNTWIAPEEDHQKYFLDKNQLKSLKRHGFKYSNVNNPYFVGTGYENVCLNFKSFKRWENIYLTYDITCNQDDTIYFLLNNKIPFVALCHYDEELVTWDGKCEYFYKTSNTVELLSKNGGSNEFDCGKDGKYFPAQLVPKIEKYNVKEWMEKERKYVSSLV